MALRFLGGDSDVNGSPRMYEEGGDFLVQGYVIEDPELLQQLQIPEGETVVRVPKSLMKYLPEDVDGAAKY
ncbi:hypothetical protein AB0M44_45715 [Streptosporangium subroseum]|uniref:hypothetical protein n=1 Tax=Streptosporangium subroseum TaxID=106412 RepID=UPI003424D901